MKKLLVTIIAIAMLLSIASIGAFASDLPQANLEVLPAKVLTAADKYTVFERLGAGSDLSNTKDRPLNVVVEFSAIDTEETVKTSPYKDWYVDFFLTFKGLSSSSFTAKNCYLSGNYGSFGWYVIPTDSLEIENGVRYPVVSAVLAPLTYEEICTNVKEIICALYLDDAIIEANPNIEVVLELGICNPEGDIINPDSIVVVNSSTYNADLLSGYVATVGSEKFKSLKDAFEACDNGTVKLIQPIAVNDTVTVAKGKNITFDLNGFAISGDFENSGRSAVIQNNGNLTVMDSSVSKTGKITSHAANPDTNDIPGYASNTINNQGAFILESGTIKNETTEGDACYPIDNNSTSGDAIVTINGGKVIASDQCYAVRMFANGKAKNSVTVNGGELSGYRAVWIHLPGSDSSVMPDADLIVNGGTLTSVDTVYNSAVYVRTFGNSYANTNITITGGIFNGDVALTGPSSQNLEVTETVSVTGGTFNGAKGIYTYSSYMTGVVSGGTFKAVPVAALLANDFETVKNAEGAYEIDKETDVPATIEAAKNEDGSASVAINAGFDDYEAKVEETKTFGVYIYKADTKKGKKVMLNEGTGSLAETAGLFNVVVTDIPETEFNTKLVCVPFVVVGNETKLGNAKTITAGSLLGIN